MRDYEKDTIERQIFMGQFSEAKIFITVSNIHAMTLLPYQEEWPDKLRVDSSKCHSSEAVEPS